MGKSKGLNVGVIGAGFMGGEHIKGLRDIISRGLLPISLTAIAGLNHAKGKALARKLGCPYHEGGSSLIADPNVDVVVIASPTHTHFQFAKETVAAGKPIFLEKPMGRSLAEAEAVSETLRNASVPHQIGLVLRFAPAYNVLKEMLADKANGKFIFARVRDDQFFPIGSIYDSDWRQRVEKSGGGALIEHSIHDVDVIHWFFGTPTITDSIITPSHKKGIEKLAAINMTFASGGSAQLSSVWHHNLARENSRHLEIFFENRFYHSFGGFTSPITVEGPKGKAKVIGTKEIEKRYRAMIGWKDAKNAPFTSTVGHELYVFLNSVLKGARKGAANAANAETGLAAHRFIESAYRMGRKP